MTTHMAEPRAVGGQRELDALASAVSILSDHGFAVAVLVAVDTLRSRNGLRTSALRLFVVGVTIVVVNVALKRLINRPRPESARDAPGFVRTPTSSSFPSGHTLAAAAAAVALPRTTAGRLVSLSGASLVGWSRVRLGAHHRSDVIGGLAIGAVLGAALRLPLHQIEREWNAASAG